MYMYICCKMSQNDTLFGYKKMVRQDGQLLEQLEHSRPGGVLSLSLRGALVSALAGSG